VLKVPDEQPIVAVTVGDPAGIGPEVLARCLDDGVIAQHGRLLLIGSEWALQDAQVLIGRDFEVELCADADDFIAREASVGFVDVGVERPANFCYGQVNPACGESAVRAVEQAARLAIAGRVAAMVTCPINKEAVHAAGYVDDIGHQEILARLSGAQWTATLLMTPGLKVVHLSTHKSLIEAARYVTRENVAEKLRITVDTLQGWGLVRPRIAVAALNPHAGEGGLLGREELDEIGPAVADARAEGMDVLGPLPADSVFNRAIAGEFDVVLAMYHDQGHIAIKVHDFEQSVTATMGVPFIRTSVDHGTAFDIAGTGCADATSLEAAVDVAVILASGKLR
jgi:4-hydroxythreonine-4-phosphate dehydrogenase